MSDPLLRLGRDQLRALSKALRDGRLAVPLTELALRPYVGREATHVESTIGELTRSGLSSVHLAHFLDLLADQQDGLARAANVIELVSTGPEAAGYPTRDTRIVVRELFSQANDLVMVAGYAVYQGRDVFRALGDRMAELPGLQVRMFLDVQRPMGDTSSANEILRRFSERFRTSEWPGLRVPDVYYDPRSLDLETHRRVSLHAKCVVVDHRLAFVSSANFTEAAQLRNIEVGVLVRSVPVATQLATHFDTLVANRVLDRVPGI